MCAQNIQNSEEAGKPQSWFTAFYYLAQHLRRISKGKVNHKLLYSYVGIEGRYINHDNPAVRKCTAGSLSHIIHSRQYAEHMRRRFSQNGLAFENAARNLQAELLKWSGKDNAAIRAYLLEQCWPDVATGLRNERFDSRQDLDLVRIRVEMDTLSTRIRRDECPAEEWQSQSCAIVLEALLDMIAFGHLDAAFARTLFEETPFVVQEGSSDGGERACSEDGPGGGESEDAGGRMGLSGFACVVKYADAALTAVVDWWPVSPRHPFTVGRYTDCDAIDEHEAISRVHCCIYCKDGTWYFEDMSSRHGCVVRDANGNELLRTEGSERGRITVVDFGCSFSLAGVSHYRFLSLRSTDARNFDMFA